MNRIYKSKIAKWYIWFCIIRTIAFIYSLYLCYKSTWVLLIDIFFMGVCLIMIYDMLLHTDYTQCCLLKPSYRLPVIMQRNKFTAVLDFSE